MGILSKIFGTPAVVAKGAAGAAVDVAKGASDIVERWVPSAASKQEVAQAIEKLAQDAAASARSYDPRSTGSSLFTEIVNVTVDAIARLIRPVVTVILIGGVFGWWSISTKTIDPIVLGWAESTIVFWFGARTLFKDFPALLSHIKSMRS